MTKDEEIEALKLRVKSHYKEAIEAATVASFFEKENFRLNEMLQSISDWQNAYPLDIFPEPDFKKARAVLESAAMSLDEISASNFRHVLNGIKKIVSGK